VDDDWQLLEDASRRVDPLPVPGLPLNGGAAAGSFRDGVTR